MRKLLLVLLSAAPLAAASMVAAADLPLRSPPPPPPQIPPLFTWTGPYVGINAGVGFDTGNRDTTFNGNLAGSPGTIGVLHLNGRDGTDFVGGGQLGYNYQFGAGSGVVIGLEADAQYNGLGRRGSTTNYTFTPAGGLALNNGLAFVLPQFPSTVNYRTPDFFGTVRGRIGYGFDRTLVYGTGGFAYDGTSTGYTFGGGIEYAFTPQLSARIEDLYVNIDDSRTATYTNNQNGSFVDLRGYKSEFDVLRVGLNYKFY